MKQHNFVKYHPHIDKITGSQQGTLILSSLEFWFIKKPDGFYKFIEPCSHRLYKKGDSWLEEVGLSRKRFARAFEEFGIKYHSRSAFEEAEDKFEGKLYASYYDRHTNQMFFIRNHDLANEVLKPYFKVKKADTQKEQGSSEKSAGSLSEKPLSIGQNGLSYIEPKNTSNNLSKDKSHAEEIIKKMIELWTALVEEGRGQIQLTGKRIAFLRKAFVDKFDSCLEKWKKYCQDIASSRFLMGEIKSSFRATLDWALKFDVIQKILEGNYGVGDRRPSTVPSAAESFFKNSKVELASEEEAIQTGGDEPELVREFRLNWLNRFGVTNYRECLKDCEIEGEGDATLILRPSSRYNAKSIASYWTPKLLAGVPFTKVHIVQQEGELVFDKWFGLEESREGTLPENEVVQVKVPAGLTTEQFAKTLLEATGFVGAVIEQSSEEPLPCEDEEPAVIQVTSETQMLRKKLRESIPHNQFPTWLGSIEVEEVSRDGSVIVTFEDSFAVGWSRSRFSKEVFQAASSLWRGVDSLVIRQKAGDTTPLSVEKPSKKTDNVSEKSTLEQAIQSLLSACSPGKMSEALGMQGTCQAFA